MQAGVLTLKLFEKHAGRPLHYSFDYGAAHFTVLDTSRSDELSEGEHLLDHADRPARAGPPGAQPVRTTLSPSVG